jgi:hypothetical protein
MAEVRGNLQSIVDDISEHIPNCTERYPYSCSRVAMHVIELKEFIRDQPRDVRRYLINILQQAQSWEV